MKRKLFKSLMILGGALFINQAASAAIHTISVSDFKFLPLTTSLTLGDTVKFVWGGGTHTTTSDNIPTAATAWDEPMDMNNTSFSYVPSVAGSYSFHCTPHQSMNMKATFTVTLPTAIGNVATNSPFSISPNPASSTLKIHGAAKTLSVSVIDIIGRIVADLQPISSGNEEHIYSISNLSEGTYMLRLTSENGITSQKLIIAR